MTTTSAGPHSVRQITARQLKAMLDSGEPLELWDVRTDQERRIATIPGARQLDEPGVARIEALDRGTLLVFHCHHGMRSQAAGEHFVNKGFTNVCNLVGGIEAWSAEVDPSVARY